MEILYLLVIVLLVVTNSTTAFFLYRIYNKRKNTFVELTNCEETLGYLEIAMLDLKKENEKYTLINEKLNKSNKDLRSKLDKINNKVKQISEQFKVN